MFNEYILTTYKAMRELQKVEFIKRDREREKSEGFKKRKIQNMYNREIDREKEKEERKREKKRERERERERAMYKANHVLPLF